jgi:hypothetical protein
MEKTEMNLIKIDAKVADKIYDDLFSPALKVLGKVGEDVAKSVRYVTAPIQRLAAKQDQLENHFKILDEMVPEENRIEVPPYFSVPIVERLTLLDSENKLADLYINLLARAMDKDRVNEAHPAFTTLIEQLAPDEALFLYILRTSGNKLHFLDKMDYDKVTNRFYNREEISSSFPKTKLAFPENFDLYASHLEALNLVTWPVIDQLPIKIGNIQTGIHRTSEIIPTEFGLKFIEACVPSDGTHIENLSHVPNV